MDGFHWLIIGANRFAPMMTAPLRKIHRRIWVGRWNFPIGAPSAERRTKTGRGRAARAILAIEVSRRSNGNPSKRERRER